MTSKKEYVPTPEKDPGFDGFAKVGGFARVVEGDHTGRYGVVESLSNDGKTAVFRTRDDDFDRLLVPFLSLRPDTAGKR